MKIANPIPAEMAEAMSTNGQWWWLSFCDADLPEGQQFLGACVVKADDEIGAVAAAHLCEINPGGEVVIAGPLSLEQIPPEQPRWALLTREDIQRVNSAVDARRSQ